MNVDAGGGRMLLILDLDETLIHVSEAPLKRTADFRVDAYHVYRRPHVAAFLSSCAESFRVAFWSSASESYVAEVLANILPDGIEPAFAWGRDRCTPRFDPESLIAPPSPGCR